MVLRKATAVLAATLAVGGAYWIGCGDDDGDGGAVFFGDVSSVSAGSAATSAPRPSFAERIFAPRNAWAQSTCAAPSDGNLLFCVNSVCTIVEGDCDFSESVAIENGGPVSATLRFVDDADGDGEAGATEDDSVVPQNLLFCDGDQVQIDNASVNFLTGATSATVSKLVDNCSGNPSSTNTPGGGGSGTPTRTPTRTPTGGAGSGTPTPTRTPTYAYGAMMNEAPGSAIVFLASLGVIGLLVPKRRRRDS